MERLFRIDFNIFSPRVSTKLAFISVLVCEHCGKGRASQKCYTLIFNADLFDSSRQSDLVWRPHRRKKIRFPMKLNPMPSDATLLAINSQNFCMLHVASVCTPCCMLLGVVAQSLKPFTPFSQQLPTFLLFCDSRSVGQQC